MAVVRPSGYLAPRGSVERPACEKPDRSGYPPVWRGQAARAGRDSALSADALPEDMLLEDRAFEDRATASR